MSDRETNSVRSHFYGESKNIKLIETDQKGGLPGTKRWGKQGDIGQRVQTFSYKISKLWESNVQHADYH